MGAQRYQIHVKGRLGETIAVAFDGLVATVMVETVLVGELADQAALLGVLSRVQALGLELVELRRLPCREEVHPRRVIEAHPG